MRVLAILILLGLICCTSTETRIIEIPETQTLIPEGIVVSEDGKKIYLSSLHKQKIIEHDLNSGVTKDFIKEKEHGFLSGLGLELQQDVLFAISSDIHNGKGRSLLMTFDLENKDLIHQFALKDTNAHFMNDLALGPGQTIYITDSERHCVYKLDYPDGEIEVFLQNEQIRYPNGISISDDGKLLFVDSWTHGIRIVEIANKRILNEKHEATAGSGVDGLKYFNGDLYAIRNTGDDHNNYGLIKIKLSNNLKEIIEVQPLLLGHPNMDIPTTLSIRKGKAYILANSQLENLDQETNSIQKPKELTNSYVLKYVIRLSRFRLTKRFQTDN